LSNHCLQSPQIKISGPFAQLVCIITLRHSTLGCLLNFVSSKMMYLRQFASVSLVLTLFSSNSFDSESSNNTSALQQSFASAAQQIELSLPLHDDAATQPSEDNPSEFAHVNDVSAQSRDQDTSQLHNSQPGGNNNNNNINSNNSNSSRRTGKSIIAPIKKFARFCAATSQQVVDHARGFNRQTEGFMTTRRCDKVQPRMSFRYVDGLDTSDDEAAPDPAHQQQAQAPTPTQLRARQRIEALRRACEHDVAQQERQGRLERQAAQEAPNETAPSKQVTEGSQRLSEVLAQSRLRRQGLKFSSSRFEIGESSRSNHSPSRSLRRSNSLSRK
jgi:hypothetical protein